MKIYHKAAGLHHFLAGERQSGKRIGFVPTMGALHEGHLSLVRQARQQNDIVVASIFVNPTQFDDPADFHHYPRVLDNDLELLKASGTDIAFVPEVDEIYPASLKDEHDFDFGAIGHVMEGAYRKGHFKGVGQVVSRLLKITQPHVLYLGQKDYQQYMILKKLVGDWLELDTAVTLVPTVREPDGLAMSSRNIRLAPAERKQAPILYNTLRYLKGHYKERLPGEWQQWAQEQLAACPSIKEIDYFEIVNAENLNHIKKWEDARNVIACTAVRMKDIRLIDNLFIRKIDDVAP